MSQSFLFKAVVLNEISFNPEKGWMGSLLTEQEVSILSIQGSGSKYNEEYTNLISQTNVSILSIQGSGSKFACMETELESVIRANKKSQSFLFKAVVLNSECCP
jgi:hypothetical protein